MGAAAVEGQRDGFPLQIAELGHAAQQTLAVERVLNAVVNLVPAGRGQRGLLVAGGGRGGAPDPVDGTAASDGQRPGGGAALIGVIADRGAPQLQQHVLGDFVGLGGVAKHGEYLIADRIAQLPVDHVEGPVFAPRHGAEQPVEVVRGVERCPRVAPLPVIHMFVFGGRGRSGWPDSRQIQLFTTETSAAG